MLASILMENQGIFRASAAKRPKQPQNNKMGKGNRLAHQTEVANLYTFEGYLDANTTRISLEICHHQFHMLLVRDHFLHLER
jgi:hypothetical protein